MKERKFNIGCLVGETHGNPFEPVIWRIKAIEKDLGGYEWYKLEDTNNSSDSLYLKEDEIYRNFTSVKDI